MSFKHYTGQARYRFGAKIPLIGLVPWGVVKGNEDLEIKPDTASHGHLTSNPVEYDCNKPPKANGKNSARLDPNHSHFILVSRSV
jgi:hypothetical protein